VQLCCPDMENLPIEKYKCKPTDLFLKSLRAYWWWEPLLESVGSHAADVSTSYMASYISLIWWTLGCVIEHKPNWRDTLKPALLRPPSQNKKILYHYPPWSGSPPAQSFSTPALVLHCKTIQRLLLVSFLQRNMNLCIKPQHTLLYTKGCSHSLITYMCMLQVVYYSYQFAIYIHMCYLNL